MASRLNQLPHFQFKEIMKSRKRWGSGLGPGTYHLKSSIDVGLQRVHSPGQTFSGDRRKPAGGGHHSLEYAVGPGTYNPKPVEGLVYSNQPPFWTSAKRFDRKSYRLFTGNENRVGVGRYDITKHEKYPQNVRYQFLYRYDVQRYLSNLKRDAYLL
ncbi:hypothetical protein Q9233_001369 [Columba guinea]|nr:hypothetical protein Q9233_001369 [Columba guinea]